MTQDTPVTETSVDDLMRGLGLKRIVAMEETGRAVMEFTAQTQHCHAVVQGGYVAAWIDAAMARAVSAVTKGEFGCNTLEMKVAYYGPARLGQTLTAEGWIERLGRSTVFLEGSLTDEAGNVVAKASSTAKLSRFGGRTVLG